MLEMILAFYAAGVLMAMWQLWLPSYRIIKEVDPYNIVVQRPILSGIIVLVIFTIMFPFIAFTLLFDDKVERFQNGFIKGVMGKYDDRR